jgi:hypothetical protein
VSFVGEMGLYSVKSSSVHPGLFCRQRTENYHYHTLCCTNAHITLLLGLKFVSLRGGCTQVYYILVVILKIKIFTSYTMTYL